MIFRFVFMSQGELSRKCRKFKSHPIIGSFRYLIATTYCYCRYLLLLLLTVVSKECLCAFLLKGLWRVLPSFPFCEKIHLSGSEALKILIKRCIFYTYTLIIFIERSQPPSKLTALATVLSRIVNYVNYIFSHEYYITLLKSRARLWMIVYVKIIIEI